MKVMMLARAGEQEVRCMLLQRVYGLAKGAEPASADTEGDDFCTHQGEPSCFDLFGESQEEKTDFVLTYRAPVLRLY